MTMIKDGSIDLETLRALVREVLAEAGLLPVVPPQTVLREVTPAEFGALLESMDDPFLDGAEDE